MTAEQTEAARQLSSVPQILSAAKWLNQQDQKTTLLINPSYPHTPAPPTNIKDSLPLNSRLSLHHMFFSLQGYQQQRSMSARSDIQSISLN